MIVVVKVEGYDIQVTRGSEGAEMLLDGKSVASVRGISDNKMKKVTLSYENYEAVIKLGVVQDRVIIRDSTNVLFDSHVPVD